MIKQYLVYLFRWQLSTPIMTPITLYFGATVQGAVIANLAGGLIFFWIDKFIFSSDRRNLSRKYLFYLGRWQLTSFTLYPALLLFGSGWLGVIMGNLIGGLIFFWVDKYIFLDRIVPTQWEISEKTTCHDCGKIGRGYRLVKTENYDKSRDLEPEFRCESCSVKKTEELKSKGIKI